MHIPRTAFLLVTTLLICSCGGGSGGDGGDDGPLVLPNPTGRVEGRITFVRPGGPPIVDVEPNDGVGQTQQLPDGFVGDTRSVFGTLDSATDAVDAYRLRIPLRAQVNITLRKATSDDFQVELHEPVTMQFVGLADGDTPSFQLIYQGTIDLVVSANAGDGNYELAIAVELPFPDLPESEPNSTPQTATPFGEIGANDAIRIIGDANATLDAVDALLVLAPQPGTMHFRLELEDDDDPGEASFSLRVSDATAGVGAATELTTLAAPGLAPRVGSVVVANPDTLLLLEVLANSASGTWSLRVAGALAGGSPKPGVPSTLLVDPPELRLNPTSLNMGATRTLESSTIFNDGDDPLLVTALDITTSDGNDWLSASFSGAGDATKNADRVLVLVERAGLAPGNYTGEVTVRSNGGDVPLPVAMEVVAPVPIPPNLPIVVQAISVDTSEVVSEVTVNPATGLDYVFAALPVGQYVFVASSDIDGDGVRCEPGDFCGGFPTENDLLPRTVVRGFTLTNINFSVERDSVPVVPKPTR